MIVAIIEVAAVIEVEVLLVKVVVMVVMRPFTAEVRRVFDATRSVVARLFGIRADRARTSRPWSARRRGAGEAVRGVTLFHPVDHRGERVELRSGRTATAVIHARNH